MIDAARPDACAGLRTRADVTPDITPRPPSSRGADDRSQFRRVLVIVRKATRGAAPEVRQRFKEIAGQAFAVRLDQLIREDDRRSGAPAAFEVVGALWVRGGPARRGRGAA